jgi:hypothetical protein|tara:strand:- start:435 stop:560 length:126 start_codon:yes stop_codon:yes gene_type:complete
VKKMDKLHDNRHHEAGKGAVQRFFTDKEYKKNYDRIFKKKK